MHRSPTFAEVDTTALLLRSRTGPVRGPFPVPVPGPPPAPAPALEPRRPLPVGIVFLLALPGWAVASALQLPLAWDGASKLLRTLHDRSPYIPHDRHEAEGRLAGR